MKSFVTCVALLAVCGAWPYADSSLTDRDHSEHGRSKQTSGIHMKTKRAAVSLLAQGALALRSLLSGAKSIHSSSNLRRCFEKKGTFFTALKDFEEVKPKGVKEFTNERGVKYIVGWVGDRKLKITSPGAQGDTLFDIIDITQTKLRKPGIPYMDRIIYTTSRRLDK